MSQQHNILMLRMVDILIISKYLLYKDFQCVDLGGKLFLAPSTFVRKWCELHVLLWEFVSLCPMNHHPISCSNPK